VPAFAALGRGLWNTSFIASPTITLFTAHSRQSVVTKTAAVSHWNISEMPHDVLIGRDQAKGANS
jgi:hypothetical protein